MKAAAPPAASEQCTLVIGNRDAGLFSNFNHVVDNLVHRLGRGGVAAATVEWRARADFTQFPYGTAADGNLWPRFFEPLQFAEMPPRRIHTDTYVDLGITHDSAYRMYKLDFLWRRRYHAAYRRHIRPVADIAASVRDIRRRVDPGCCMIGVHFRHPDHREGPAREQTAHAFLSRVRRLVPRRGPWAVALATDTEDAVDFFRAELGDRLIVQPDVARTSLRGGQLHYDNPAAGVALGRQAVVDCLLLAECDVLLHTTSNLATAVGFINPHSRMIYCETPRQALRGLVWSLRRQLLDGRTTIP
ncbi:MAG TPA: hypothetical protein VEL28_13475 [Candidatus Binatia bacterium]|nr:hypothetical protein [Candidatus Binatia bacterium]